MIPKSMRGVLLLGHGGLEQLRFRDDLPVPVPAPGEVLIEIGAAAINNTDINLRTGWYSKDGDPKARDAGWTGDSVSFPRIQGADACGHIVAVGAAVEAARIGERVLINPLITSQCYLGSDCNGTFAQFVAVPAANACKITSMLSDAELASFPCSYSAAENMLTRADVVAGETVLVTGASGGVGSAAVQLCNRRGARVIAVTSKEKAGAVKAIGAASVLAREMGLPAELGHESVDAVLDIVGGQQFPSLLEVLRRGGRYAVAGAIGGALVNLDLRTLYLKDLRLLGCTQLEPQVFGNLIGYIERGEIKPVVSAAYPLSEIAMAQMAFLSKAHVGKIVLTVCDS
jgi:NADPH:quinone reductase-like Zn-dependent oxidoreductase